MKRILLLGSTGQIGFELARLLPDLGELRIPIRARADLRRPEGFQELLREERPDLVVNAAAFTDVDAAEKDPQQAFAVNATGPRALAEAAAECGAALIHYSTDYVFDGRARRPYRETDPPGPLNVYGASKLAGEKAILDAGGKAILLRTGWIYGLRGRNVLTAIRRRAGQGERIRAVRDRVGAPTWSASVARGTFGVAARALEPGFSGWGLYHMTCRGRTSWRGFARAILRGLVPVEGISSEDWPQPAVRPAYSVLDNTRLAERFGIRLPTWASALRECLALADSANRLSRGGVPVMSCQEPGGPETGGRNAAETGKGGVACEP